MLVGKIHTSRLRRRASYSQSAMNVAATPCRVLPTCSSCLGKVPPRKLYRHDIHQFARHINHLAHSLTGYESLHLLGGHSLLLNLLLGRIIRDIDMVAPTSIDLPGQPYSTWTAHLR